MPPRKKQGQVTLPGMTSTKDLHDTLWKAADKLRGSMDAAQYKDFVLGLVFLKYVSDSFAERREQIRAEVLADGVPETRIEQFLDDVDEYTARRRVLGSGGRPLGRAGRADQERRTSASCIDDAMDAIMKANASLTGVLPKIFNRDNVDQRRLGELVDLISDARFTGHGEQPARDVLGEVYEYFLETVRPRRGQARRRVLHAGQRGQAAGRGAGAVLRPGVRPVLRVGRHVRPGGEVRPRAPRDAATTSPSTARSPTSAPGGWPR